MAETWIINESPSQPTSVINVDINFVSNSNNFTKIVLNTGSAWVFNNGISYQPPYPNLIYNEDNGWVNENYRTINFETTPTGDLLTWLQANAEKQEEPTTAKKLYINNKLATINGKTKGTINGVEWDNAPQPMYTWYCTVSNLGAQNPNNVIFTHNGTMPVLEQITFNGDSMIKIPTMYRKVNTVESNQITSFTIADGKVDDSYVPYPCFIDESGNLLDYVLIGRFMSNSSSTCVSQGTTGQTSGMVVQGVSTGRTNARARGSGYQLYDWQMQKLWQDLIICKMNTVNINTGSGITTDVLGFEWEKSGGWVDGICRTEDYKWLFSYKPSKYVNKPTDSTTGYNILSYTAPNSTGAEVSKLGYDTNNPFVNYPNTVVTNSSFNTYYCDNYAAPVWSSKYPVNCNVGSTDANFGAWSCLTHNDWDIDYGVRLCYRPIS